MKGDISKRNDAVESYKKLDKTNVEKSECSLTLRGQEVHYPGVQMVEIRYEKCDALILGKKRYEFGKKGGVREQFLKDLGNNEAMLKKHHFSEEEIAMIKDGKVPPGYQVHHKRPLDDSGTNDFSNLVLIKNDPYHQAITVSINNATKGMEPGQIKRVKIPMPSGSIYP
jgi:hypothetical protein